MTSNSTYFGDSVSSPEIYNELTRRIQGERIDFETFAVVVGHDIETGFEARLTLGGTQCWGEVFDDGKPSCFEARLTSPVAWTEIHDDDAMG